MKKNLLLFLVFLICAWSVNAQKQMILNTTGYGFDRTAPNGINTEQWAYIQKFVNITYNGQDASVSAVRLHIQWENYEPTTGNYSNSGTKLAQAVAAILALKPGIKVALHFQYMRNGYTQETYFADNEIAKIADGTKVQNEIGYTCPSIFSSTAKSRFMAFVNHAMTAVSAYYSDILYVQMGNATGEEFNIPTLPLGAGVTPGFYEEKALEAWRTQYLPCRYPGQSTVVWNGTTRTIASAPPFAPGQWDDWSSDHGKEYHRFASWGLMKFFKEFRDIVKSKSSSLKVLYFVCYFGTWPGNMQTMHNASIPMALNESDGIYTSDGINQYDNQKKIMPIDIIKGTNSSKIAGIEFDQEDLGQENPSTSTSPINTSIAQEWMARAYKHGVDYIHLAMHFNDVQIGQLKPVLASMRSTYLNGSYTSPSHQAPVSVGIVPNVFTTTSLFEGTYNSIGGNTWSSSDVSPKSISMNDDGYWQNIWSCTATDPCDFNITSSGPSGSVAGSSSVTLNSTCSGQCSGVSYAWSGNGISGTSSSVTFSAPSTAGTYTYTLTASKSGCTNKTTTVQVVVGAACDFNISASVSNANPSAGAGISLSYSCSGANCSGVSYAWSGNGISGSSSPLSITSPSVSGAYTYTVTATKSGCSNTTANVSITVGSSGNACNYVDKQTVGTWSGLNVQTRQYTVSGAAAWLIVTAVPGSSVDKHFPRGKNFADRGDISWSNGVINKTCLSGGETGYSGLVFPSGVTVPSGYSQGTETDGAIYFQQTGGGCSTPAAPSLSASPSSITSGASATLSASGCSGGTITWSNSLGTGTSKSVAPTSTTTYTASCTIGACTSSNGSVTVTVTPPSGTNCNTLSSNVDGSSCSFIEGWVYDQSSPNAVVYVDIYEGSTLLLSNVAANKFRQDLLNAGFGNGAHGLEVATPASIKNGQSHTITIKVSGCNYQFNGSPRTISGCSNNLVLDPGIADVLPFSKQFIISPNPNKGIFETNFFMEKNEKATLVITDLQGRMIFKKTITGQGVHKERIDISNKAAGTLLVQLHKVTGVEVKKINIVR